MFTVGVSKMTNVIFSYCITKYRAMTNALSYTIKRVQLLNDLKIHSSEEPTKKCTVAKCEVSWADSTLHDVRGYIGCHHPCWRQQGSDATSDVMTHVVTAHAYGAYWPRKSGKVHLTFEICLRSINKYDGARTKPTRLLEGYRLKNR